MKAGDIVICINESLGVIENLGGTGDDTIDKPKLNEELVVFDVLGIYGKTWLSFEKYNTEESNNWFMVSNFELKGDGASDNFGYEWMQPELTEEELQEMRRVLPIVPMLGEDVEFMNNINIKRKGFNVTYEEFCEVWEREFVYETKGFDKETYLRFLHRLSQKEVHKQKTLEEWFAFIGKDVSFDNQPFMLKTKALKEPKHAKGLLDLIKRKK